MERKKILFLTFYFKPDLCAGSFRNSPLLFELAQLAKKKSVDIDVFTTLPNRYSTFSEEAPEIEEFENVKVRRVVIPKHKSGFIDQIFSFKTYFDTVNKEVKNENYDLVYASSSRLFTAYLGHTIAKKSKVPLYLDIRDIFVDTIKDVVKNKPLKALVIPILKRIEKQTFSNATHINLISGGFKVYFERYKKPGYTYFTNGIDEVFIKEYFKTKNYNKKSDTKKIVYAGNFGEGQGLHKIVPQSAKILGKGFEFHLIGDGGAKQLLLDKIEEEGVDNVFIIPPMNREELIKKYHDSDYLLIHLNDYDAFKKVLPSKIFELAMFKKPLLVGVNGYARAFIEENLSDSILFEPGNAIELTNKLLSNENGAKETMDREAFINNFNRENINTDMAISILNLIH
ncbi:glycosyltransferase family 4 protein [Cognataquiflexum rubidum]|uniref:glycosyltransferase family 4 protein n=1 Tax=Cognataquiflexum rubidum TaxID=2922273 RepID=UPI001F13474F|nr:glycosyltransferase family 4 protein [Cognataquiflexum rubidum]MCH6236627.1 glycosyltransferase family 4 protein [Cognataquiflexum rubidum]